MTDPAQYLITANAGPTAVDDLHDLDDLDDLDRRLPEE